ncbi:MAG: protease inhibitor I42 family protein [Dehalococcoidales bacterium]|nr:protease inhibitor I42 family protein [Dehalococcoidales bacterium]
MLITRIVVMVLAAVFILSMPACLSAPAQYLSVGRSSNGKEVRMAMFGTLVVTLESAPTATDYRWSEAAVISDKDVIKQTGYDQGLRDEPPRTMNYQTWTFTTFKSGESTLSLEYRPANDPDAPAADYFTLNVNVR